MNRLMALVAFAFFLGFLAILIWHVPRLDLGTVIAVTVLLAGYDLFLGSRNKTGNGR